MPDSMKHVLLVEDEAPLREALAEQLADHGYAVEQAESGETALAKLADFAFDVIITDLRLPGIDGSAVIDAALDRYPDIVAIVVTGFGTVKDAVEAIKRGAWDFVSKPFQIDELLHALDSALEQRRLKSENAYLRAQLDERYRFEGLIGKSPAMKRLFQLLETVAGTNSTILIAGETGTGKEVVARSIHHNSPRKTHRFRRPELQRDSRNAARSRNFRDMCAARSPAQSAIGKAASSRRTAERSSSMKWGR
jgi:two-component system response regulator PilR (NtrC family)